MLVATALNRPPNRVNPNGAAIYALAEAELRGRPTEDQLGANVQYSNEPADPRPTSSSTSVTVYYYGDFYKLSGVPRRSTLELVTERPAGTEMSNLSSRSPDIVVVMANPGKSKPMHGGDGDERMPTAIGLSVNLVEAVPDPTQVQIKAIMECKRYRHVRVLNLSDVCETSLKRLGASLSCQELGDSVFACPARREELAERLNPRLGLVVAAWGYEDAPALTVRGKAAYDKILDRGYSLVGSGGRFAHPLRKGQAWVADLVSKLPPCSAHGCVG